MTTGLQHQQDEEPWTVEEVQQEQPQEIHQEKQLEECNHVLEILNFSEGVMDQQNITSVVQRISTKETFMMG